MLCTPRLSLSLLAQGVSRGESKSVKRVSILHRKASVELCLPPQHLKKSNLLLGRLRSTVPGLVDVGDSRPADPVAVVRRLYSRGLGTVSAAQFSADLACP